MARAGDRGSLDRQLDRLYGLPLSEFTAARNTLARELKGAGEADAATRVQKLSKPTRAAAAINRAVRENRREARRLLSAAGKLAQAQERLLEGGSRTEVHKAVEQERAAVDRLMERVRAQLRRDGGSSQSMVERARDTLHAVATTPELREELAAGRVAKDHQAVGFGGLSPAAARPSRKAAPLPRKKDEARRRLKRAEQELDAAGRALQRAEADRDEARKRLAAAEAAVASSEKAVADAAKARDAARAGLERA